MTFRGGILMASLSLALPAAGAALVAPRVTPPVSDIAAWFPVSLEPIRQTEAPLKPVEERSIVSNQLSQQDIPVPATVQNLRRADR